MIAAPDGLRWNDRGFWMPYLFGLAAIACAIWYVTGYFPGGVVAANDLRLNINKDLIGDPYVNMVSWRYGHDDFVYISFAHIFLLARLFGYNATIALVFFGIPILGYTALVNFLRSMPWRQAAHKEAIWLEVALSCVVILSAGVLVRFMHWPILLGYSLLPFYLLALGSFLSSGARPRDILAIYVTLYLGASNPYMLVIYFVASVCVLFETFLARAESAGTARLRVVGRRVMLAILIGLLTQLHWIVPFFTGQGLLATPLEAAITLRLLNAVSSNSNFLSAISGENYFDNFVRSGFFSPVLILLLVLLALIVKRGVPVSIKSLTYFGLIGIVATGSKSLPGLFEMLLATPFHKVSWLIKDPSIYAPLFSTAAIVALHHEIHETRSSRNGRSALPAVVAAVALTSLLAYFAAFDAQAYQAQVSFFRVPEPYLKLRDALSSGEARTYRNFWMPHAWYYRNGYNLVKHPATPAYWLTSNKELVDFFSPHKDLVALLEQEAFREGCRRKHLIAWLLRVHQLQVVVDDSIIDDSLISPPEVASKARAAKTCLSSLPGISLVFTAPPLAVYRGAQLQSMRLFRVTGSLDDLNRFLEKRRDNVVFVEASRFEVDLISESVSVLAEPHSRFWSLGGLPPEYLANFSQPAWVGAPASSAYEYHNERRVDLILSAQQAVFFAAIVALIILLGPPLALPR